ncbi:ATP phosphoribosyltransferase regulatory subunit [Enhygromyxa salina]|uniref:ATP phosphoribosyltransferase regulatory subunit n=1 Tax=Enhygromyxa salina TaxID=215803 RepID=A0A2S9XDT0_9BACT|nr:ATP phosphoribosyltransferase regulatory subunit [Enhygromyxa salina]PRP91028.1 ATP phosphoribosyltransferase regulatory subunit [Enhygromyxa salina]
MSKAKAKPRVAAQPQPANPAIVDASVFNPLPVGARDLLPAAARRRRALTSTLLAGFERWGYREVTPPLIEYFEVLGRGLGPEDRERCVRFIEAGTGGLVALRSDVTPQIARMVAQRVGGTVAPDDGLRLCYAATLVRLPSGRHDRAELHQVGVEYVGDASPTADAELVGLADQLLITLGSSDHRFDLSHSAVVRDALAFLALAPKVERELRDRLARKDRDGLAEVLARVGVGARAARVFASLADLHGPPALLASARTRLREIGAGAAVDRLAEVVRAIELEHPRSAPRVLVDLGEARGFDYYTGVRLRVWAPGVGGPIVRGGRYDDLVARYGAALPATGLAFDLDALEQALATAGAAIDGAEQASARLVVTAGARVRKDLAAGLRSAAVREAADARRRGLRAWIDREPKLEQAQRSAERHRVERLTWLFVAGRGAAAEIIRQRWRRGAKGWRQESETTMSKQGKDPS